MYYAHISSPNRLFRSLERLAEFVIDGDLDPSGARQVANGQLVAMSPWDRGDFLMFCREFQVF